VRSIVAGQITDTLNANLFTIKNVARPGFDSLSRKTAAGLDIQAIGFIDGAGYSWNKQATDTTLSLGLSITPQSSGPKFMLPVSSSSFTVSLAAGIEQYFIYEGTANATITVPTTSTYNGMYINISNTTSFNIAFNVPVYTNSTTSITAGSAVIGPLGMAFLIKSSATGNWFLFTTR
jgi:hypothetical protein